MQSCLQRRSRCRTRRETLSFRSADSGHVLLTSPHCDNNNTTGVSHSGPSACPKRDESTKVLLDLTSLQKNCFHILVVNRYGAHTGPYSLWSFWVFAAIHPQLIRLASPSVRSSPAHILVSHGGVPLLSETTWFSCFSPLCSAPPWVPSPSSPSSIVTSSWVQLSGLTLDVSGLALLPEPTEDFSM